MSSKGWCLDHENIFILRSLLAYVQISSRRQCPSRQWDRLLKDLSFERNGWLGVRDKRFTPEHEVLRYVGCV
ncbi:BnaCnng25780D [Brassica napus]|uniref:BnaCnng25780D protein n=1 Tax=Brassica napus TaxID=3708 RepID=A0A078IVE2_BRANA|nr:BnaCnng25780D [Brassica napus]